MKKLRLSEKFRAAASAEIHPSRAANNLRLIYCVFIFLLTLWSIGNEIWRLADSIELEMLATMRGLTDNEPIQSLSYSLSILIGLSIVMGLCCYKVAIEVYKDYAKDHPDADPSTSNRPTETSVL